MIGTLATSPGGRTSTSTQPSFIISPAVLLETFITVPSFTCCVQRACASSCLVEAAASTARRGARCCTQTDGRRASGADRLPLHAAVLLLARREARAMMREIGLRSFRDFRVQWPTYPFLACFLSLMNESK